MGKSKGKGKKFTLTNNNDDVANGEEEKIPVQKRRGRPQKPLTDEIDEGFEKIKDDDENASSDVEGKKRRRNKETKENGTLLKEDSSNGTRSNGFRHIGSRRKNKPHRAAEAGVECK
ncbi:uncharacterized protein [Rutidosis leptorrhynchoides]|uniref:uncharacterized protein n=1 Tax=Rutidosis leptorrhynchoides TaxID=125765 RepID=UPI003A98F6E9